jgi:hypothetical protein
MGEGRQWGRPLEGGSNEGWVYGILREVLPGGQRVPSRLPAVPFLLREMGREGVRSDHGVAKGDRVTVTADIQSGRIVRVVAGGFVLKPYGRLWRITCPDGREETWGSYENAASQLMWLHHVATRPDDCGCYRCAIGGR